MRAVATVGEAPRRALMRLARGVACGGGLVALAAGLGPARAAAQTTTSHVLVLDVADPLRPAAQAQQAAFVQQLNERTSRRVQIYLENLDLFRFATTAQQQGALEWWARKYATTPLDVIVAVGRPALVAAEALRARLGRPARIILIASVNDPIAPAVDSLRAHGVSAVVINNVEASVIRHALALFPDTRTIVTVSDDTLRARILDRVVREASGGSVGTRALHGLTLPAFRDSLAAMRADEIALYWAVSRDAEGGTWIPADALAAMQDAAVRPIVGTLDNLVGIGSVGGPTLSYAAIGRVAADRTAELLAGADPVTLPTAVLDEWRWVYDWALLRRFDADRSQIPADAEYVNRPEPYYQSHPLETAIVALLLLAQFVLIVLLVRRSTFLRYTRTELQEMSERLMVAQDQERGRIARDLHDGICQELSLLSIDLGRVDDAQAATLAGRVRETITRTQALARGLHPAYGPATGLAEALDRLARSVQAAHGVTVRFVDDGETRVEDDAVAMPLYRIAQEALTNTVRHARATFVEIRLAVTPEQVILRVRDDGAGFTFSPRRMPGIGLVSMRERARALGGRLMISTAPGEGTLVMVSVPRLVAARPAHA